MTEKVFNYVVARPWKESEPDNLCIYMYNREILKGSKEDAEHFLEYVKRNTHVDIRDKYSIYEVIFKEVK